MVIDTLPLKEILCMHPKKMEAMRFPNLTGNRIKTYTDSRKEWMALCYMLNGTIMPTITKMKFICHGEVIVLDLHII